MKPTDPREPDVVEDPLITFVEHALREGDVCVGCGLPTGLHRTIGGVWIGCKGALNIQHPPRNPERWNDPDAGMTCAIRKALLMDCGPEMEIHCASYTFDELLTMASAIARAVRKEESGRTR